MLFAFYNKKGEIIQLLSAPNESYAEIQSGNFLSCPDQTSYDTHYVDLSLKKVVKKKPIDVDYKASDTYASFNGLPEGLVVSVGSASTVTDKEPLIINWDVPGTYSVKFSGLVDYLDSSVEVTIGNA